MLYQLSILNRKIIKGQETDSGYGEQQGEIQQKRGEIQPPVPLSLAHY